MKNALILEAAFVSAVKASVSTSVPIEPCGKITRRRWRHHLERLGLGQRKDHGMWGCTGSSGALMLLIKLANNELKMFWAAVGVRDQIHPQQERTKVTEFKVFWNRPESQKITPQMFLNCNLVCADLFWFWLDLISKIHLLFIGTHSFV